MICSSFYFSLLKLQWNERFEPAARTPPREAAVEAEALVEEAPVEEEACAHREAA